MNRRSSRKRRFLSPGWLMFLSALLCVVLVPLVQAAIQHSGEKAERARKLTQMTESERLKIQHSFAEFQRLSPAKQESYRDLDRRLNTDDRRLKDTLASYEEFLSTLSPVDRAQVDRASTLQERLSAIREIQKERADLRQQLETAYSMIEERSGESKGRWSPFSPFSVDEMQAITKSIEEHLPSSARQKYKLDAKTGAVRFAWAIVAALDVWKPSSPRENRELFPEELKEDIIAATLNEEIRKRLEDADQPESPSFTQRFLWLARGTVGREYAKNAPDISKLSELLNTLGEEDKKNLMSQDPRLMYFDLIHRYFEKNPTELSKAHDEFREKSQSYLFRGRPPGGGRGGPRGRGRPDGPGDSGPGQDDSNSRFNRNDERSSRGDQGAFNENRRGRGFRDGGFGERFGNGGRREPDNVPGSD